MGRALDNAMLNADMKGIAKSTFSFTKESRKETPLTIVYRWFE